MSGSVNSIETFGLVDGPGIRTVVFLNGCKLRCIYCHNPETWKMQENNFTAQELAKKIIKNKPYFKRNGGATFSGGEPLLQSEFIIEVCKILKNENIHIALDTAGVGNGNYEEILSMVDLVLLDIKHTTREGYKLVTGREIDEVEKFIEVLNKSGKKVWIRQVIVPGITDSKEYILSLKEYIKKINNIEKIELLPYHTMAIEKYEKLGIEYPLKGIKDMDKEKLNELYEILNS